MHISGDAEKNPNIQQRFNLTKFDCKIEHLEDNLKMLQTVKFAQQERNQKQNSAADFTEAYILNCSRHVFCSVLYYFSDGLLA